MLTLPALEVALSVPTVIALRFKFVLESRFSVPLPLKLLAAIPAIPDPVPLALPVTLSVEPAATERFAPVSSTTPD
jgi:hypothetical protein